MKKILITGSNSGLGKFLKKKLSAMGYYRGANFEKLKKTNWDLIIHCAFTTTDPKNKIEYNKCINDNLVLSYNISKLKGKKIFISSCAVYENEGIKFRIEKNKIFIKDKISTYAKFKLFAENFFDEKKDIILRLGSIIGKGMKKNTILKLIEDKKPRVFIRKESIYSFVTYDEILNFINLAYNKKMIGIFNFLRSDYTELNKITQQICLNKKIQYGNYNFQVIKANNNKLKKLFSLKGSSISVVKKFYENT